jgi:hypothetical protein
MTRTSREPMLAYTRMNIPRSWATSLLGAILRVITLAFWVGIALLFVHLMGWADKDIKGPMEPVKSWPFSQNQK